MQQDKIYHHLDYEQVSFSRKSGLYFNGWSFRNWKIEAYLQLAKHWNISTKVGQNILFHQPAKPIYDVMQKEIENLEFVRGVKLGFFDSLKNNVTKYLLISDDPCEAICNSKAFVDIATAAKHRGLSTSYIKHNFFHQSKLGRDVELRNTHIALVKSPRHVMPVPTLSTQLVLVQN